jgi:hypothetical protein
MRSGWYKGKYSGCISERVAYTKWVTNPTCVLREDRTFAFTFVVFVVVALCCATNVEISRLQETE